MLYKPTQMVPHFYSIDATTTNLFECVVNAAGDSEVIKYRIDIFNNLNEEAYSDEVVGVSLYNQNLLSYTLPPNSLVNGDEYYWRATLYVVDPLIGVTQGVVVAAASTTALTIRLHANVYEKMYLKIGEEVRKISSYDVETGDIEVETAFSQIPSLGAQYRVLSDFVTSDESYFTTKAEPTLSINPFPLPIASQQHLFFATFTQPDNSGWEHYWWSLYDNDGNLIANTDYIHSGEIKWHFNGFINGESYSIEVNVLTKDKKILTDTVPFSVAYLEPEIINRPLTVVEEDKTALKTTWDSPYINLGIVTPNEDNYEIVENFPINGHNSVKIYKANQLKYVPATSTEDKEVLIDHTTFLSMVFPFNFQGTIYRESTVPIVLIASSSTPPNTFLKGDKYYNTTIQLIYTAIEDNVWGIDGEEGKNTCIYEIAGTHYVWDEDQGKLVNYTPGRALPYWSLSYKDQVFTFTLLNGKTTTAKTISFRGQPYYSEWLLQTAGYSPADIYSWKDTEFWDDILLWHERNYDFMTDAFWEIVLHRDYFQIYRKELSLPIPENPTS